MLGSRATFASGRRWFPDNNHSGTGKSGTSVIEDGETGTPRVAGATDQVKI